MCKYLIMMFSLLMTLELSSCTMQQASDAVNRYPSQYMGDNVYQVRYSAGSELDYETLKYHALRRAARLTLSNNKQFFEIISEVDGSRQFFTLRPPSNVRSGLYNEDTSPEEIYTYGGTIVTHLKQQIILTIKLLPQATSTSVDAQAVLAEYIIR